MALKVGIVGAGHIGGVHGKILAADKRVQVVGVADVDEGRARSLASTLGPGVKALGSLDELLNEGVEAVFVCTPNTRHKEPVLKSLRAGAAVFSEKPMATSVDEALEIFAAVEETGGVYQLGLNRRFAPAYKAVKQAIESGAITPTMAHIKMNRGELMNPPWVSDRSITGGFLYESTFHLIDMGLWLFGPAARVYCAARSTVYDQFDDFACVIEYESGVVSTLASCAHATWAFPFERVEVFGKHCSVVTEEMEKVATSPGLGKPVTTQDFFQLPFQEKWGYVEEDGLFVEAVLGQRGPAVDAAAGLRCMKLTEAIYKAAAERVRVEL